MQRVIREYYVAIIEPDPVLRELYAKHVTAPGVVAVTFAALQGFLGDIVAIKPSTILLNPLGQSGVVHRDIAKLRAILPATSIITISHQLDEIHLQRLMEAGVTGHINRSLTTSRNIALVLHELLEALETKSY